jgi:hypothetical protein
LVGNSDKTIFRIATLSESSIIGANIFDNKESGGRDGGASDENSSAVPDGIVMVILILSLE